jgi:hypothetical protein
MLVDWKVDELSPERLCEEFENVAHPVEIGDFYSEAPPPTQVRCTHSVRCLNANVKDRW